MIIAIKLVRKRSVLPRQILQLPKAIQIPITPSGGTNEAAIATPASPADIFLYPKAKNATNHDAKAIHRSIRVGWVLEAISLVTWVSGMSHVRKNHINTPHQILSRSSFSDFPNNFWFPVAIAKATHWIGLIIGAISIAHITTGVAFISKPRVATTTDKNIWLQYSRVVSTSSIIVWAMFVLTSPSRSRIAILSIISGVWSMIYKWCRNRVVQQ